MRCKTAFNAYSVKFSPFIEGRFAVSTGTHLQALRICVCATSTGDVPQPVQGMHDWPTCMDFHPHGTSPHSITLFCCAAAPRPAAQNFGIVGNGRQHVFQVAPGGGGGGGLVEVAAYDTLDGVYDCAWNEENENILLAASGDGSIKVYDLGLPPQANPLRQFHEHKHEVGTTGQQLGGGDEPDALS